MTTLQWSEALELGLPCMDNIHREFVDLLAQVESATDADLLRRWQALLLHTEAHFGQEDRWMADTGFPAAHCHATQHEVVLRVMGEGCLRAERGDLQLLRMFAHELANWFPMHAQTMDAALALHLRNAGVPVADAVTRVMPALPQQLVPAGG